MHMVDILLSYVFSTNPHFYIAFSKEICYNDFEQKGEPS